MKTLLASLFVLVASSAAAQPVTLKVVAAPDPGGLVTSESKIRAGIADDLTKRLSKEKKLVTLGDGGAVIEIVSRDLERGLGTVQGQRGRSYEIYRETVKAVVRFKELEHPISVTASNAGSFASSVKEMLAYQVKAFIKDNAEKLR